ncbi:MAG: hypothetical protein ACF8LL_08455, partial [Phycisphaerales bacterium]
GHRTTIRVIESLVELYESWDAAAPGQGHADSAEEWRAELLIDDGATADKDGAVPIDQANGEQIP